MIIKPCADSASGERLDRKGNALAATNAQGHDTTLQSIDGGYIQDLRNFPRGKPPSLVDTSRPDPFRERC